MSYNGNFYQSQPTLNQLLMSNIPIGYSLNQSLSNCYENSYNSCGYNYQSLGNHYNYGGGGVIGSDCSPHQILSILPTISAPK